MPYSLHTTLRALLSLCAAIILTACDHKELTIGPNPNDGALVKVEYSWSPTEPFRPEGMANIFYSTSRPHSGYWRYDCSPEGGATRLPADTYHVVSFNNDTENVIFEGIESFEALTFSTLRENTNGIPDNQLPSPPQKLFRQPDRMWSASECDVALGTDPSSSVILNPHRITCDYHLRVVEIGNLQSALRYYAAVSGLAGEYKMAVFSPAGDPVTMGGMMTPIDNSTIGVTITNFGLYPDTESVELSIYLWLADGSRKIYRYHIMEQIITAPDPHEVVIEVRGPELPEIKPGDNPGGSGSGIEVGVDDWDVIDIEL